MSKNKQELDCFALLIREWNSFYSFGVNRGNPKLKTDMDYPFYEKTLSLELTCQTYQNEKNLKLLKSDKVIVHFVPKSEDHFKDNGYENIGLLIL